MNIYKVLSLRLLIETFITDISLSLATIIIHETIIHFMPISLLDRITIFYLYQGSLVVSIYLPISASYIYSSQDTKVLLTFILYLIKHLFVE